MIRSMQALAAAFVVLGASLAAPTDALAAPRKSSKSPPSTVVVAPYAAPFAASSDCELLLNPNVTCSDDVAADTTGHSSAVTEVLIGENELIDTFTPAPFTTATYTIPLRTTTAKTAVKVDAAVRVHEALSEMIRTRFAWGNGPSTVASWISVHLDGHRVAQRSLTHTTDLWRNGMTYHLVSSIENADVAVAGEWAPADGIPAGDHELTVVFATQTDAFSNGEFRSRLDATLNSVTITTR